MPLSFPSSPQPGDIFTAAGRAWSWTGTVWRVQRIIAISEVTDLAADLATRATTTALATLESSLGTLATQSAEAVEIIGGSAHFDTLSAGNDHAAADGYLTVAANGDLLGTGANRILGFIAGGATY
jgi:hypothetical protein